VGADQSTPPLASRAFRPLLDEKGLRGGARPRWRRHTPRPGCRVAGSIGARDVIGELESLFARHGKPRILRSDNGREFIAASLLEYAPELLAA
jgi:hypothetical protein